ncbi:MAG: IPT/TIG domain-containing protein [Candidatus Marinimicrobia bacterium]|nr:IPT/TIG domain-containing protein [Candidatus Neomarinimicrobiota bacterium]
MKTRKYYIFTFDTHVIRVAALMLLASLFFTTCDETAPPNGAWPPPVENDRDEPVINRLDPPDSIFAGVGDIIIYGDNFSPNIWENLVNIGGTPVKVLSIVDTILTVETPLLIMDSATVKLTVIGADYYAGYNKPFTLVDVAPRVGSFTDFDDLFGLAVDVDENVYISMAGKLVLRVATNGDTTHYGHTTVEKYDAMKIGPGGALFGVNILPYIFQMPAGGGGDALFAIVPGGVDDLDFDQNGILYAGGSGNAVYAVKPDGSNRTVASYSDTRLKSLRVFDGYVYIAGNYSGDDSTAVQQGIWRNAIESAEGDLGLNELVLDWSEYTGAGPASIQSINFNAGGTLYIGTSSGNAIVTMDTEGKFEPLYPRALTPQTFHMCWGNGINLYVNRRGESDRRILKVNVGKLGAPYYGRQ